MKGPLDLHGRCGECLLYGAIQGLDDGLLLADPEGCVFHVNRRAEEMLGLVAAKAMGGKVRALLKPASLLRFWTQAAREKEPVSTELALPSFPQIRATITPCRSAAGEPIGRALMLRDVSREKRILVDLPATVAQRLVEMAGLAETTGNEPALTARERQILALLTEGLSNAALAARLKVSVNTVASHLKHLYPKIGVGSRAQAVAYASARGIRPPRR